MRGAEARSSARHPPIGETERGRKSYFPVRLVFSSDEALRAECGCPECAAQLPPIFRGLPVQIYAGARSLLEEYLKDLTLEI